MDSGLESYCKGMVPPFLPSLILGPLGMFPLLSTPHCQLCALQNLQVQPPPRRKGKLFGCTPDLLTESLTSLKKVLVTTEGRNLLLLPNSSSHWVLFAGSSKVWHRDHPEESHSAFPTDRNAAAACSHFPHPCPRHCSLQCGIQGICYFLQVISFLGPQTTCIKHCNEILFVLRMKCKKAEEQGRADPPSAL